LVLPFALASCDSGRVAGHSGATPQPSAQGTAATSSKANSHGPSPSHIPWTSSLTWYSYEQGVSLAKQSGKPILLLVYADWCSKCRALAPVFERSDVHALASKMIVVRQDQDQPAPWLTGLGVSGNYVPRIIFLNADGTVQNTLTSGHPRYPFFYAAERPEILLSSLKLALKI